MGPRACVRVYARARVPVPPNLYIHTYINIKRSYHMSAHPPPPLYAFRNLATSIHGRILALSPRTAHHIHKLIQHSSHTNSIS